MKLIVLQQFPGSSMVEHSAVNCTAEHHKPLFWRRLATKLSLLLVPQLCPLWYAKIESLLAVCIAPLCPNKSPSRYKTGTDALGLTGAGLTVKSEERITVSLVSKSIEVMTSIVYRPGDRELTGMKRSIVSCSPPWCK
jgi:hypothetical protein